MLKHFILKTTRLLKLLPQKSERHPCKRDSWTKREGRHPDICDKWRKVGQGGVDAGRDSVCLYTHASDLSVAVVYISMSSLRILQNIQGSAHVMVWIRWAASQTPPWVLGQFQDPWDHPWSSSQARKLAVALETGSLTLARWTWKWNRGHHWSVCVLKNICLLSL